VEDAYINSAPYTNANTHISAPDVSNTYSRINENSARSHSSPQVNSSCVSSHASSHSFGTTHFSLPKVHACDFTQKTTPNSISTVLQKPIDRAATAVAAIVVGDSGGREEEETRMGRESGGQRGFGPSGFYSNRYALSFGPSLESIPAQSAKSYRIETNATAK
jgi:hypothetical protein